MKHLHVMYNCATKYLIIFFFTLSFISCNEEFISQQDVAQTSVINQDDMLIAYPKRKQITQSRSLSANWDAWTKVKLASGDSVHVPWNNKIASTAIPIDIRQDIKSNNGWDLIAHTINGHGEPGMNYLIFHNKYTGILKVFYYLESSQSALQNTAIWKLHFEVPQSCLAFSETIANISTKKDVEDIYLGNITNDKSKGYTLGWNCFQTELAYDPDLTEGTLQIIPSSMTTSNISLSGDIETKTEGVIISATNSNIMNGAVKSAAGFAGKEAEKWVEKAIEGKVFKKITSLVVNGAGSLVTSGVSSLLGSFIGGFNKEQQTTQSVQLKTSGTISLEGEIKTLQTGLIMPLSLSISTKDVGRLGVWCLTATPILGLDPYALHEKQNPESSLVQFYKGGEIFTYLLHYDINPDLFPMKYEVKSEIFESAAYKQQDIFKQGWQGMYGPDGGYLYSQEKLYDQIYTPRLKFTIPIILKDKNGVELSNFEANAPLEIYIPKAPTGEVGANPLFTINSYHLVVVTVEMKVGQTGEENTIVSSHTFIPHLEWDLNKCGDYYYSLYPFNPIDLTQF